ncbi:bifunctional metallophosphatase/5'-nucleotidase [Nitrosovibrio tenuis]|uniref:5'-nucleotidase n=1 Tax=Nitrosovibrio tenuis TaxID=1233 RepID=A0A1H7QYR8_9PROT|nr:bifunctional metallophosphatase/5'-nucleotidase [Nitrosovibrio tenuis]SEL53062.1 5'-nucleotidase [Nitrosovibrio tenuis]
MIPILKPLAALIGLALAGTATANCTGNITIGEDSSQISTAVANKTVGATCLNNLIIDTEAEGANYRNHGEFVARLSKQVTGWARQGILRSKEAAELRAAGARSEVGKTLKVRVIAFNDFHGNIDGADLNFTSPVDGIPPRTPAGGVDYLAGLVKQLKASAPNNVVVSAGDLIGASPLDSALFHDEPTIETMNRLGLEFNAVGNHEFDEGREELLRMQNGGCHPTDANSCQGNSVGTPYPFEGARFDFLAANVMDTASGKTLFPAYGVKNFKGNRVAFIGMTLKGTPSIVTPAGISGLAFKDEADTVNQLIGKLKRHGINAVVVLLHEGGLAPGSINGCAGVSGPIVDIVKRLDDAVDLIISGHTHQAYNCTLPNSTGRTIPVTSAGAFGRLLTSIDLILDTRTKDIVAVSAMNKLVDRDNVLHAADPIKPVDEISVIVANYQALAEPIANRVIGSITANITAVRNAAGESALGDVIADSQLAATAPPDKGGAAIAFMNTGGIRADLTYAGSTADEGDGNVTYGEAFTVQPFGNSLTIKTLTGQQLYDLLNQQWAAGQYADGGRTLQISNGFTYQHTFVPKVSPLGANYVCDGSLKLNGVAIDKSASYRVTMNSFLASGGDNYSVFNLGTNQLGGDVDLDALEAYLHANPGGITPGSQDRIRNVAACN